MSKSKTLTFVIASVSVLGGLSSVFVALNFQGMKDYRIRRELVTEYGDFFEFEFEKASIIFPYSQTYAVRIHCANFCEDEVGLDKLCKLPFLLEVEGTYCDPDQWDATFSKQGIYWFDRIDPAFAGDQVLQ